VSLAMKKVINLQENKIEYTLKISKQAKRVRLVIYCDGSFVVTIPKNMNANIIEQIIIKKSHWIINKLEYSKNNPGKRSIKGSEKDYKEHKDQALALAKKRIEHFNQFYNFKFNKISIKNQKTRWGSCSKKGNLNFNYKISLIPEKFADYIIVHELCHLKEFNHSKKFWNLVGKTVPDYLELKRNLNRI
jgi:hypothetical protein